MGNICTETKHIQTQTIEFRTIGTQTEDHGVLVLTILSPTNFMNSTDSYGRFIDQAWSRIELGSICNDEIIKSFDPNFITE